MGAFLSPCAMAGVTLVIDRHRNFFLAAENSLLKGQLDIYVYISALSGAVSSGPAAAKAAETAEAAAKHTAEDIAQITHIEALAVEPAAAHAALFKGRMTELVVLGALLAVAQHLIRFVDFLEFFFRLFIALVLVGMVFHRHFAVGFFQLRLCCVLVYAQNLIIISFIRQLLHHLLLGLRPKPCKGDNPP